jgi:hypothetical protein
MRPSIGATLLACILVSPLAQAQRAYPTPDAASEAFVNALRRNDLPALQKVLGADYKKFIPTGDIDRADVQNFLAAWDKQHKVYTESEGKALLSAGDHGWTLPVPIIKGKEGWHFDPKAGADEMRTRRIGRNELATMQAVLAYYDAQREYAAKDRNGDGVREYAQRLVSSYGKHDGLYWPDASGQDQSPLGPQFESNKSSGPGYHGYHYKILTGQGKDAPGGAYDYIIGKRMRSGFALVAWPVKYGDTGVMSFTISHEGTVYEKDLGPSTDAAARALTHFNPDKTWKKVPAP